MGFRRSARTAIRHPQGFSVSIAVQGSSGGRAHLHALAEDGQVQMPIQQTFWAARFGMLVDRFGIPWMVNCGLVG